MALLWAPRLMIEKRDARSIRKIMEAFEATLVAYNNPDDVLAALGDYAASEAFKRAAEDIAMKMMTQLGADGNKTWREAAREGSMGKEIYKALKQELIGPTGAIYYDLIYQNASLIRTLPDNIAEQVTRYVAREQQKGRRAEEIAQDIQRMFPSRTKANAQMIARTEVSKASTALTRARCDDLGINWYVWRTSEDQRVRDSHRKMDDVLVSWRDPPSPEALNRERSYGKYHAGNTFNCRCYPEPLIELHYIRWPHKVYHNNQITMMTLEQFRRLF